MLNSKFLAFNTPNTKNSVTSDISNLKKKKIDMGLQCCSKNETVRSKMLKIFFIFYSLSLLSTDSQLSVSLSILSLSLSHPSLAMAFWWRCMADLVVCRL